jgi:hypothetical protein
MFINSALTEQAFHRLAEIHSEGKAGQEVASAVFYLFAFELSRRKLECRAVIDLDPTTEQGERARALMRDEFSRLAILSEPPAPGLFVQALDFGCAVCDRKSPEKRIGSNFFTVPLKRASQSATSLAYPNRRHGPLLKMGRLQQGKIWCLARHERWIGNLKMMLAERKSSTPFTDLLTYVFRNSEIDGAASLSDALVAFSKSSFCPDFADELCIHIGRESDKVELTCSPFVQKYSNNFRSLASVRSRLLPSDSLANLNKRIKYLENLLNKNRIPFERL